MGNQANDETMSVDWLHRIDGGYAGDLTKNKYNQSSQNTSDSSASICSTQSSCIHKGIRLNLGALLLNGRLM